MKILTALDGSSCSKAAVDRLLRMPGPAGSTVTLLNVLEPSPPLATGMISWPELRREMKATRERARDMLATQAERLAAAGFATDIEVRDGHVAHVILETARDAGAELIAVGSHGRGTLARFLVGSVSNRVAMHADCPVLVARPAGGRAEDPLRILVAYDGSEPSRAAVQWVAEAPWRSGAVITVLTVHTLEAAFRPELADDLLSTEEQIDSLQEALDRVVDQLRPGSGSTEPLLLAAFRPHEMIVSVARDVEADLIVLGHKGQGAVAEFLLGSVAQRVLDHAPCSVLVVRR